MPTWTLYVNTNISNGRIFLYLLICEGTNKLTRFKFNIYLLHLKQSHAFPRPFTNSVYCYKLTD